MQTSSAVRPYTFGEEVCNCAIHGLGIIFSVAGLAVLVSLSSKYGDLWTVASTAVFGVSMILLYTASTLYHAVPYPRVKKVLPHRHLLSDRRQLHALFAGQHARAGRLVGFCRHLEPGAHRHGFENRHFRQRHQTVVDFALSDHGLGNHFRFPAAVCRNQRRQRAVSRPRRPVLHFRRFLLRLEKQKIHPCRLAPDGACRHGHAFFCRPLRLRTSLNRPAAVFPHSRRR